MTKRYLISIEPIGPSGVVLTIAELPRLVIFGRDSRRCARVGPRSHRLSTPRLARWRPNAAARAGPRPRELTIFRACIAALVGRHGRRLNADLGGTNGNAATCSAP